MSRKKKKWQKCPCSQIIFPLGYKRIVLFLLKKEKFWKELSVEYNKKQVYKNLFFSDRKE